MFPLSGTHYMEMQGNPNFRQRSGVATIMAELSGFCALSGIGPLRWAELDQALFVRFGRPDPPRKPKPHGWGFNFAFGENSQWLELTGTSESTNTFKAMFGDEGFRQFIARVNYAIQLEVLRGPSDSEVPRLRRDYEYRPEESVSVAESRAQRERDLVQQLASDPAWTRRIGNIVAARTLCWEVLYLLPEALTGVEVGIDDFFANGKEWLTAFVSDMPTIAAIMALVEANHRTTSREWSKNDIHDIDALSVAVPYCDIVVTEKHAHAQLHKAGAEERFHTTILRRLKELPDAIEARLAVNRGSS